MSGGIEQTVVVALWESRHITAYTPLPFRLDNMRSMECPVSALSDTVIGIHNETQSECEEIKLNAYQGIPFKIKTLPYKSLLGKAQT